MKNKDFIFCIVGESGSGKTTIVNELNRLYSFTSINSYTTRPMRFPNEPGHIFITDEEFDELEDDMVAYTNFNGFDYCCTNQQIDENDLYVVDLDGIEFLRKKYKGKKHILSIYISTPEQTRRQRMLLRGDSPEKVEERIQHDKKAFKDVLMNTDYMVSNVDLNKAVENTYEFIMANLEAIYEM